MNFKRVDISEELQESVKNNLRSGECAGNENFINP